MKEHIETLRQEALVEEDPRVIAILDEMIERLRSIVDQFEALVQEGYRIFLLIKEIFSEVKNIFMAPSRNIQDGEYLEMA